MDAINVLQQLFGALPTRKRGTGFGAGTEGTTQARFVIGRRGYEGLLVSVVLWAGCSLRHDYESPLFLILLRRCEDVIGEVSRGLPVASGTGPPGWYCRRRQRRARGRRDVTLTLTHIRRQYLAQKNKKSHIYYAIFGKIERKTENWRWNRANKKKWKVTKNSKTPCPRFKN